MRLCRDGWGGPSSSPRFVAGRPMWGLGPPAFEARLLLGVQAPNFRALRAVVAQLVRAPDCGSGGRWFEPTQLYQCIIFELAPYASRGENRLFYWCLGTTVGIGRDTEQQ